MDSDAMGEIQKGTVASWLGRKGYGFIKPMEEDEDDVFFHVSQLKCDPDKAVPNVGRGEDVEYQLGKDDKGKTRAMNVTGPDGAYVIGYELGSRRRSSGKPQEGAGDDAPPAAQRRASRDEPNIPAPTEWSDGYKVGKVVRWFRGYGFVQPLGAADNSADIFLHATAITGHRLGLRGAWVQYKETEDDDGRLRCEAVSAPGGEPLRAPRRPRRYRRRNSRKNGGKSANSPKQSPGPKEDTGEDKLTTPDGPANDASS